MSELHTASNSASLSKLLSRGNATQSQSPHSPHSYRAGEQLRATCPKCKRWYEYIVSQCGKRWQCDTCGFCFLVGEQIVGAAVTKPDVSTQSNNSSRAILDSAASSSTTGKGLGPWSTDSKERHEFSIQSLWWVPIVLLGFIRLSRCGDDGPAVRPSGTYAPFAGDHRVGPYRRSDGTSVRGH